jgi:hypothetical protein
MRFKLIHAYNYGLVLYHSRLQETDVLDEVPESAVTRQENCKRLTVAHEGLAEATVHDQLAVRMSEEVASQPGRFILFEANLNSRSWQVLRKFDLLTLAQWLAQLGGEQRSGAPMGFLIRLCFHFWRGWIAICFSGLTLRPLLSTFEPASWMIAQRYALSLGNRTKITGF